MDSRLRGNDSVVVQASIVILAQAGIHADTGNTLLYVMSQMIHACLHSIIGDDTAGIACQDFLRRFTEIAFCQTTTLFLDRQLTTFIHVIHVLAIVPDFSHFPAAYETLMLAR
jgi:hypothetical protein